MNKAIFLLLFIFNYLLLLLSCASGSGSKADTNNSKAEIMPANEQEEEQELKRVDIREAHLLLKEMPEAIILDVRTPEEFGEDHLQEAVNINFSIPDFEDKLNLLDKTRPYFVHCQSGGRSMQTFEIMKDKGFKKVFHIDGGFAAWKEAGFETTKE